MNQLDPGCTSAGALGVSRLVCRAAAILTAGLLVAATGSAWAQSNPSTCTKTGPALLLTELRDLDNNGVGETPIVGSKIDGETIYYQASLFVSTATGQCAYEGGTLCIDRPGASGCVDVTPLAGIPLLCDNDTICNPDGVAAIDSLQIPYVVNHNDFDTTGLCVNQVRAVAQYRNGTSHFGQGVFPVNADTPICNPVLFCGDSSVNIPGETCDPPGQPGGANGNTCRGDCTVCGDGHLDSGEACDDGNTSNTDSCRNSCILPICGDGIVDAGEQCDDGNTNNTDSCRNNCTAPICGDGIVDAGEQCDDGNTNNTDSCRNNCTTPICGDGIVDAGEQCDDGNTNNTDSCRNNCTTPICGDGIVDAGEQCDDGNTNNTDSCRNNCTTPRCGDGIVDAGEQCDDGNTNNTDSCRNNCTTPICGDGIVDAGEQCDDGNTNNTDSCRNNCTTPRCGDGIVDAGEQCDDGNTNNTDSCANDCTIPPRCGDSIVGNTPGETCDPPGSVPDPGPNECRNDCTFCGDGHVDGGESCDDGNQTDGDGCSASCTPEGSAICRTPGFWGTHAFANPKKKGSQNITQAVIDAAGGCLEVCGEVISDTEKNSADSALEAICISIKGDSRLQLARQLTAAALNCVISGGGSDCAGTSLYSQIFSDCNSLCANSASDNAQVTQCIDTLDCLNNGGNPLANGQCQTGVCSGNHEPCDGSCSDASTCEPIPGNCHERILVNEDLGLFFDPPGPAGSDNLCNEATGNACKVLQPGEAKCSSGTISTSPETCP